MTRKLIAGVAFLMALCAAKASAGEHAGLCFDLPEGWHSTVKGNTRMVNSPDEKVTLTMVSVSHDDLDATVKDLDKELEGVEDIDVVEMKKATVNELPTVYVKGTGVSGDRNVRITAAIVDAGDHCLVVLAMGSEESLEKYGKATRDLFKSIRRQEAEEFADND